MPASRSSPQAFSGYGEQIISEKRSIEETDRFDAIDDFSKRYTIIEYTEVISSGLAGETSKVAGSISYRTSQGLKANPQGGDRLKVSHDNNWIFVTRVR